MNTIVKRGATWSRLFLPKLTQIMAAAVGVLVVCSSMFAQGNAGRILGTVTDQTGGALPGAMLSVIDIQRGVTRTLTADDSGAYSAPNLLPGTYTVTASFKGFKTAERAGFTLEVNQELRVDLQLQPGDQTQKITVTGELPQVETTNATVGGTLQNNIITSLPLNGRNFTNLLVLRPGVTIYPGGGGWTQSTNGIRAHDNSYMVDGVNSDEPWTGQSVMNAAEAAGDAGTILPVDAIDEFRSEINPKAEYGWKPGGVINVGIKSGTNDIHGTAYAYGRDTAFDARNYFNNSIDPVTGTLQTKQPVSLEQFGATVGGPIKKDKLFYFLSYEDQRYSIGNPFDHSVPATTDLVAACNRAAILGTATALSKELAGLNANCSANATFATAANGALGTPAFQGIFPVSPSEGISTDIASTNQIDSGLTKIDYHLSDKNELHGMYFISEGAGNLADAPSTDVDPAWLTNQYARAQTASVGWTFTPNSSWVNDARVGYAHYYQRFLSPDSTQNPASYSFNGNLYQIPTGITNPFYWGLPGLTFQGPYNLNFTLGGSWPKVVGPDGSLQLVDHISVLKGKHAFMFGGEILNLESTTQVTNQGKGPLRFGKGNDPDNPLTVSNFVNDLEPFFMGDMNRVRLTEGNPLRNFSGNGFAAFLQDDWRVKPRVTVNLGLRYEINTVPKEANGLMGNFDPTSATGLDQISSTGTPYKGDHNNFSPRLGLAWDIKGDGKTVLRAGGSLIYEQLSLDVFNGIGNTLGLRAIPTGLPLFEDGQQVAGTPVGNINFFEVQATGAPLGPVQTAWQGFVPNPSNAGAVTPANALYTPLTGACGDGSTITSVLLGTNRSLIGTAPPQCPIVAVDPNVRTPYVENWLLDLQRAITSSLSLDLGYIGNHGVKLLGMNDINQPAIGSGWTTAAVNACLSSAPSYGNCAPDTSAEQAAQPFSQSCTTSAPVLPFNPNGKCYPYLGNIDIFHNRDTSSYNGLQAVLTQRPWHGLSYTAGYTYSHALGESSDNWGSGQIIPINNYAPDKILWAATDFDIRHRLTLSGTYALPGRKGLGQLLDGWALNTVVTIQSGQPWGVADTSNDFTGTNQQNNAAGSEGELWDFFGNPSDFTPVHGFTATGGVPYFAGTSNAACLAKATAIGALAVAALANTGCFANGGSVMIPPAYGTSGNMARNIFRDAGFRNWDLSVSKNFRFKERLTAQFRAELFNILNHPIFNNPSGGPAGPFNNDPSAGQGFGLSTGTPDTAGGNPQLGSGGARAMQLGAKLTW
jgi:hypothetical protein